MSEEQVPQSSQDEEEDISHLPLVLQIMSKTYKPRHIQEALLSIREQLIFARAFEKLDFSADKIYQATAAHGAGLGALRLIDDLIQYGKVID